MIHQKADLVSYCASVDPDSWCVTACMVGILVIGRVSQFPHTQSYLILHRRFIIVIFSLMQAASSVIRSLLSDLEGASVAH